MYHAFMIMDDGLSLPVTIDLMLTDWISNPCFYLRFNWQQAGAVACIDSADSI